MGPPALKKYTFFTFIFTAAALVALFLPEGNAAGPALALAYFLGNGQLIGSRILPRESRVWRCFWGTLTFAAAVITAASLAYYFYRLDLLATAVVLILTPAVFALIPAESGLLDDLMARLRSAIAPDRTPLHRKAAAWLAGLALLTITALLVFYGFDLLTGAAGDNAMRSPWDSVPRMFFVVFFLTVLSAFITASSGLIGELALLPIVGLALLATGVAAAVYSVGFGFDPFIHQATEAVIYKLGAIQPKPFYYIGQYATVVVLARMFKTGVAAIDAALVPAAFALTVPAAFWSLKRSFSWSSRDAAAASLALLLLPLSPFIATTPQGFADALALVTFFLALPACSEERILPRPVLVLLAVTVTLIHPLAGIPLLIFTGILLFLTAYERRGGVGRWLILLQLALAGCIALPLAFMVNAKFSGAGVTVSETLLRTPGDLLEELSGSGIVSRQFNAAFDFVYFWRAVREAVLAAAGLVGLVLLSRRLKGALAYGISFLIFIVNYILLRSVVSFPFLIEYERSNYADRIFDLALFLLTPAAVYAFGRLIGRVRRSFPALRIGLAVLIAVLATSSLYLAYPRRDKYESSRGWSTSAADIKTVRSVAADAGSAPYVVLANQAVSAGAVRELGFRAYFPSLDADRPGDIYFYPIPTGGPLYADFLEMNSALGSPAVARRAMDLTGVDTVYFVVTNYWWHAQKIISSAKKLADGWWTVDDTDYVFKYVRNNSHLPVR